MLQEDMYSEGVGRYDLPPHIIGATYEALPMRLVANVDENTPVNLTDSKLEMTFREERADGPVAMKLSNSSGLKIITAENGEFEIEEQLFDKLDKSIDYHYDLVLVTGEKRVVWLVGILPVWRTASSPING